MAVTERGDPHAADIPLFDGHSSTITLALNDDIAFYEKTVTPPGMEGGDPIDTTTMHNTTWRTKAPRSLVELEPFTITAAYDPILYTEILAAINRRDTITVTLSDGTTIDFLGYVQNFKPNECQEGEMPDAAITFVPTLQTAAGIETAPNVTEVSGT